MEDEGKVPNIGDLIEQEVTLSGKILRGVVLHVHKRKPTRYRVRYLSVKDQKIYGIDWRVGYTEKYWKTVSRAER